LQLEVVIFAVWMQSLDIW